MYTIRHGTATIGHTRLETPWELTGHAQGVFEPTPAFSMLHEQLNAIAGEVDAQLGVAVREGHISPDLVDDFREMALLHHDSIQSDVWIDIDVISATGRPVSARVDGFAETEPGRWVISVTVNDAAFWRRAAEGTL